MRKIWTFLVSSMLFFVFSAVPSFSVEKYNAGLLLTSPTTIKEARYLYDSAAVELKQKTRLLSAVEAKFDVASRNQKNAWDRLERSKRELVQAEKYLLETTRDMDTLVREMYMTGSQPSSIDVVFADPRDDSGGMLATYGYLSSAAAYTVEEKNVAQENFLSAQQKVLKDTSAYDEATIVVSEVHREREESFAELKDTQLQHDIVKHQYDNWIYRHYWTLDVPAVSPPADCKNWLVRELYAAGFRGENVREAWAIAMRESGGREDAISPTQDYGVFQFNKPTWGGQDWWDDDAILTREYNIGIAYKLSQGGKTWLSWGLTGQGKPNPFLYYRAGWSPEKVESHIVLPYLKWFKAYPCTVPENE